MEWLIERKLSCLVQKSLLQLGRCNVATANELCCECEVHTRFHRPGEMCHLFPFPL